MDAKQFLAEFGHIANAPGGVQRLRNLVLNYAIQGKLSATKDTDTEISVLVKNNEKARERLIKDGKLRRKHKPIDISEKEIPWPIPSAWSWFRLGALTNYGDSQQIVFDDVGLDTWILELEDIEKVSSKLVSKVFARERKFKSTKNEFKKGSVLYGKLRPYLDKVLVADDDGVCSTEIIPITFFEGINAFYLRWYLKSPFFVEYANNSTYGMNLPRMGTESARLAPFPLPPLEEQSRIVAKVDELMALCDKLESQQQKKRKLQNKLRQSVLQAVANAESPKELQDSWERLAGSFSHLFAEAEDVMTLRQIIRRLAISGLLTHHRENGFVDNNYPWQVPTSWKWLRTEDLGESRLGKMLDKAKNSGDLHPYLRNINVRWGMFDFSDILEIRIEDHELEKVSVKKGDLVICEGGEPGRAAIWDKDYSIVIQKALHRFRCYLDIIIPEYLLICLTYDYHSARLADFYTGVTIKHLTGKSLANYSIPVPPVSEQIDIVKQVNYLMTFCDTLETKLRSKQKTAERLATAAIASLTGISTLQQEEPMKVPKTELKAPVRLGTAQPPSNTQAPLASLLARHSGEMGANDLWQRFGGEVDAFYAQLKSEVMHGWIAEPTGAQMLEKEAD